MKTFLTLRNYTPMRNKTNRYIVLHYTANNGDTAYNNCVYFHNEYRGASANYFVDENDVWQCVADKDSAWHVGAKKYYNHARNENSIGIEMCSRKDSNGKYYFLQDTVNNAIELTTDLMIKYNIPIKNVCRHYDVTHKVCPEPWVTDESLWKNFLNKVEERLVDKKMLNKLINKYGESAVEKALTDLIEASSSDNTPSSWAVPELKEAMDLGITDGTRPRMYATREQVALMVKRAKN